MGTYYAPLVADFFVMKETSCRPCLTIIKLMISTSIYLDDLINMDTPYFDQMVS